MALFRSIATIGSWTMGSRVLGFVRDILIASMLGAGQVTDAFFVALQLPNIFRRLFAEGAFNSAFIPILTGELNDHGRLKAREFAGQVLGFMLLLLIIISVLVEIYMPEVISLIAGGFSENPETFSLAVDCARLTFPYLFFVSIAAMFSGILNTFERFVAAAAAPLILNVFLILALMGVEMGWFIKPSVSWAGYQSLVCEQAFCRGCHD
jgi:putative peptidoglycan lipid II flippase